MKAMPSEESIKKAELLFPPQNYKELRWVHYRLRIAEALDELRNEIDRLVKLNEEFSNMAGYASWLKTKERLKKLDEVATRARAHVGPDMGEDTLLCLREALDALED
jgi:hypothetical protein